VSTFLGAAFDLHDHGYSVIPIRTDGSKAPALASWKRHTTERATTDDLHAWFGDDQHDVGVVQGAVSGHAELTEIEGRAVSALPDLKALAHDTGLGDLWDQLTSGWVEMSPSGGLHFHYRLVDGPVPGNTKLARDADKLVLAETRGEGGQVVVAPSRHHATGRPWARLLGGPATTPVITREQRDEFHAVLRTLDVQPEPPTPAPASTSSAPRTFGDGITPGDDYENRTDWADILVPHGWQLVTQRGRTRYWLRPGKPLGSGFSATTGHADDRDRLYVFTTSTDFDAEVPYTKLGALAVLEHGGNHSAAAKALHADGYGQRAEQPRPLHATADDLAGLIAPTTNGDAPWAPTPQPRATSTRPAPATAAGPAPAASSAAPATSTGTSSPNAVSTSDPGTYSETDDGNALRLIDEHGASVRYVPQRGQWLTWTGHRWTWDEAGHIHELARDVARNLPTHDRAAERHRKNTLSRRGVEAMVALARTDGRATVHLRDLDARPYELNTPAGVVDLRTGDLHAPDPGALHTRSTAVAPDPGADHPMWSRFLADTFAGDPALTTYLQRLLGVSLVGTVLEQLLPFAHGLGANGKTTLLGVVQKLVGIGDDGYSISAPAEMLLATHQQGHPTEIARLAGARLVVTSELEDGQRFAEARIKQLTGRDVISGRFMRQDWFSFTPTHTLWLLANHQPAVKAGGPAFWRRLRLLPFEHTVPPESRIADLEDRLIADEGPAILAWLVAGARDYFTHGLAEPASVRAATDTYAADQDTVARFVADECTVGEPGAQQLQTKVAAVRAAYERWCRAEGEEPVTPKSLTQQLRARYGVLSDRDRTTRWYSGIRLNDASPDDGEPSRTERRWAQDEGW
jgi:putative DNA primase/helicase